MSHAAPSPNGNGADLTVGEVISLFLNQTSNNGRAQLERARVLDLFTKQFGDRLITEMRPADLVFWVAAHRSWKSDWTRGRILRTVQRPFFWAARLQLIERSPFAGLTHPPGNRGRPMTDQEFRLILRNAKPCFRRAVIALRFSGMRCGELRELQWEHIDFNRQCAIMAEHKTAKTRKDRRPRVIVFHPVVWRLIEWIRRSRRNPRYVFTNRDGKQWSRAAIDIRLARIRKKVGLPTDCKLHSARHGFAKQAAMNGVGMATIAELLGHTTLEMARYYVDLYGDNDHLRNAVVKAAGTSANRKS